jgi:O-antigen/teichoic acid export membrane protein
LLPSTLSKLGFTLRVRRNLAFNCLTTGVEKGLKFAVLMVATRSLGKEGWGQYAWAHTLTILLAQLTDFGLGTYLTREVARRGKQAQRLYSAALGLKLLLSGVYILTVIAVAALVIQDPVYRSLILLLAFANLGQTFIELFDRVFRGFERLEFETLLSGAYATLTLGGAVAVLACGGGVLSFALTLAVFSVVVAVAGSLLVFFKFYRVAPLADRALWLELLKSIAPIGGAAVLSMAYFRAGILIMGLFLDDRAIGLTSAASRILDMVQVLPAILMAALFPVVSRRDGNMRVQATGVAILIAAGLIVGAACVTFPASIVRVVCGGRFIEAASLLRILGCAVPLVMVNFALTHYLIAQDLQRKYLGFCFLLFCINVELNTVLIPRIGVAGSAWATLMTETALTALSLVALWGNRRGECPTAHHSDALIPAFS